MRDLCCTREASHGDKCIFHADDKTVADFRSSLRDLFDTWRRGAGVEKGNCSGFIFIGNDNESVSMFSNENYPSSDALFIAAVFKVDVSFQKTIFNGIAHFDEARFEKKVTFRDAKFHNWARFHQSIFSSDVDFWGASFYAYASFNKCTLTKKFDMTYASFAVIADFKDVKVSGKVSFRWPGLGNKLDSNRAVVQKGIVQFNAVQFVGDGILDFRSNNLTESEYVIFKLCEFDRILLRRTDCTLIEFYNVEWPKSTDRNRCVMFDELDAEEKVPNDTLWQDRADSTGVRDIWREIGVSYLQLAKKYRETLDYQIANDFDRGAFEMRYRSARLGRRQSEAALLWLYRLLSNFGGSFWKPIVWLAVLIVLFGFLYALRFLGPSPVGFWSPFFSWTYASDIFVDSIRVLGLGSVQFRYLNDGGFGVEVLKVMQRSLSALLIALAVFALRRRFKH